MSSKASKQRQPVDLWRGVGIRDELEDSLPDYAARHLSAAFAGDANAAHSLYCGAPNEWRGDIAMAAYWLGVPNPGYRTIVQCVWNHDHGYFLQAADSDPALVREVMKSAVFKIPLTGPTIIYRGTSGLSPEQASKGLSWTTSREVACWFAYRFADEGQKPLVLTATVDAEEMIYWDNCRQEKEVVLRQEVDASVDAHPASWDTLKDACVRKRDRQHRRRLKNSGKALSKLIAKIRPQAQTTAGII